MKIKIFTKKTCPKCPPAKELGEELINRGAEVIYYDMETPDGLTEASMFNVMATPTIILVNDNDEEEKSFRGSVPKIEEIIN